MIKADSLTRTYGQFQALRGLSITIQPGDFVALMGESGSGKSTFLNLVAGLDQPDSGELTVDGHNLHSYSTRQLLTYRRDLVGIVFQDINLLPTLSVLQNITLPLKLQGKETDDSWISMLAEKVGITRHLKKLPEQLSGGEQQRVAVARALAVKPKLLIADEPTGALDSKTSQDVLTLLNTLNTDLNLTILMATHSTQAAAVAHRTIRMVDGQIHS